METSNDLFNASTQFTPIVPSQAQQESLDHEFDAYAKQYEAALNEGLSVSGESPEYFAQKRVEWTAEVIDSRVHSILDFGCGVGIAAPLLQAAFGPNSLLGFDPSSAAIDRANAEASHPNWTFVSESVSIPKSSFDLAYCNGVFHHILPDDRPQALKTILHALKPGGWFAFWENNPWNPGTLYVMNKIPFDKDAVTISPNEAPKLLENAGFEIVQRDAWFIFPRALKVFRSLEWLLHSLPIGAQYLVLARKPL